VNDPVLRFMYKAHFQRRLDVAVPVQHVEGWQWLADLSDNQDEWVQKTVSLTPWVGQSGQLCFWIWPVSATDGEGVWLDTCGLATADRSLQHSHPIPRAPEAAWRSAARLGTERLDSSVTYDGVAAGRRRVPFLERQRS